MSKAKKAAQGIMTEIMRVRAGLSEDDDNEFLDTLIEKIGEIGTDDEGDGDDEDEEEEEEEEEDDEK